MHSSSFPAITTAAATTTAPDELPYPRFVAASSPLRRFPSSPPAGDAAALAPGPSRAAAAAVMAEEAGPPLPEKKRTGAGGDADAATASASKAAAEEDRMDLLWEDFNEELAAAQTRRRSRGRGRGGVVGPLAAEGAPWSESSSWSDAESEPGAARGCGPVLRPSARAGGGARHCRRRAGTWVLLMRIFRRLFVIEKTISAAAVARQRSSTRAR